MPQYLGYYPRLPGDKKHDFVGGIDGLLFAIKHKFKINILCNNGNCAHRQIGNWCNFSE